MSVNTSVTEPTGCATVAIAPTIHPRRAGAKAAYAPPMEWKLLAGVPPEEVRLLLSVARRRRFSRNEVVFHRHDPADSLHLVEKGRFAIRVMTPLGDTVTIGLRGPGESFGEMALVSEDAVRSATIVALEDAETFSVYRDDFDRLRKQQPTIDEVLIGFLAGEVRLLN